MALRNLSMFAWYKDFWDPRQTWIAILVAYFGTLMSNGTVA